MIAMVKYVHTMSINVERTYSFQTMYTGNQLQHSSVSAENKKSVRKDPSIRAHAAPTKTYRTGQTTPNTHPGGWHGARGCVSKDAFGNHLRTDKEADVTKTPNDSNLNVVVKVSIINVNSRFFFVYFLISKFDFIRMQSCYISSMLYRRCWVFHPMWQQS